MLEFSHKKSDLNLFEPEPEAGGASEPPDAASFTLQNPSLAGVKSETPDQFELNHVHTANCEIGLTLVS